MQLENSAEIFNALSDIPGDIEDVDHLLDVRMLGKFRHSSLLDYANIPASTFLLTPTFRVSPWFQFCVSVHHIMINENTSLMQLTSIYFTYSKSLHVSGKTLPIIRRI